MCILSHRLLSCGGAVFLVRVTGARRIVVVCVVSGRPLRASCARRGENAARVGWDVGRFTRAAATVKVKATGADLLWTVTVTVGSGERLEQGCS